MVTKSISLFGRELVRVERNRAGEFTYTLLDGGNDFVNSEKYLATSLQNPVLMTVLALRSRLYSQMEIRHVDKNNKIIENSPYLTLLRQPNYFQSQEDWLFQQAWFLSVGGTNFIYERKAFTNEIPKALYNLIPAEIDFNQSHKINKWITTQADKKAFGERYIKYTLDNTIYNIKLSELIPLYDMANGLINNSFFSSPSRVNGISKVLQNIDANLASKNKNLQMSAKYLSQNESTGNEAQIQPDDRLDIERTFSRKDLLITNANIKVQHLVSDMKRLFLDEQFADDANKVLLAFEMNKNVLNYFAKDSTFENQSEGIISYIQNSIQTTAKNTMNSLSSQWGLIEKGERLVASYDHLASMQPVVTKKIQSFTEMQNAIKLAIENGTMTAVEAKKMSDEFKTKLGL
jgi:hypothetical protein